MGVVTALYNLIFPDLCTTCIKLMLIKCVNSGCSTLYVIARRSELYCDGVKWKIMQWSGEINVPFLFGLRESCGYHCSQ